MKARFLPLVMFAAAGLAGGCPHAEQALQHLEAVSLLTRFNGEGDKSLVEKAREILKGIRTELPEWALAEKVDYLLGQIDELGKKPKSDHAPETVQAK